MPVYECGVQPKAISFLNPLNTHVHETLRSTNLKKTIKTNSPHPMTTKPITKK
jgi:hypothetical protein